MHQGQPFVAAMIIPTGVGASMGGFSGDASPQMNMLAAACDVLMTHPNVANAACFQDLPRNALYVEGYGLDRFFAGTWGLRSVRKNTVGVVFDRGIEPRMLTLHHNVLNAVRRVYGVEILEPVLTKASVQVGCQMDPSGSSSGFLGNPETILDACQEVIRNGAEAIALCVRMPELSEEMESQYESGGGVDPIGGVEAILSHLVVSEFQIPCAHAPVFSEAKSTPAYDRIVDPRAAAEFITPTFLPCVLTGLSRAPRFVSVDHAQPGDLTIQDLNALVVPADALGGAPVLNAVEQGIPVIAVSENKTVLNVTPDFFGKEIIQVETYSDAVRKLQDLRLQRVC